MTAFEGGLYFYGPSCRKNGQCPAGQLPGFVGMSNLIMTGSQRWRQDGVVECKAGLGTGEEGGRERMPPQLAPCRETHATVIIRVLAMTSEDQREEQADSQGR